MDLISVIVPVYKVEKYLDKCVESIVNQTYKNLEIILVDDGSPDRCPKICDGWAMKDNRVKVIHQKNGGGGKARNTALSIACGTFIGFVDSDDYIHPQMYEILMHYMQEDIDIVECDYTKTYDDEAVLGYQNSTNKEIKLSSYEALRENIEDSIFRQIIWNKLYRKRVVEGVFFPVGTKIDDEFWTYQVIGNSRSALHCGDVLYAYRQQPESIMNAKFSIARLQAIEAKCNRIDYLIEKFPGLVSLAKQNLQGTCMFLGQMSLKYLDKGQCVEAFNVIEKAQKNYAVDNTDIKQMPLKHKVWVYFSKISFKGTCVLRNILRRGI